MPPAPPALGPSSRPPHFTRGDKPNPHSASLGLLLLHTHAHTILLGCTLLISRTFQGQLLVPLRPSRRPRHSAPPLICMTRPSPRRRGCAGPLRPPDRLCAWPAGGGALGAASCCPRPLRTADRKPPDGGRRAAGGGRTRRRGQGDVGGGGGGGHLLDAGAEAEDLAGYRRQDARWLRTPWEKPEVKAPEKGEGKAGMECPWREGGRTGPTDRHTDRPPPE